MKNIFLTILLTHSVAVLAADSVVDAAKEAEQAGRASLREFKRMKCTADDGRTALEAHPESVLRWSNPVVGRVYGEVFLWTQDGRPRAVVSVYEWFTPHQSRDVEFSSLSSEPLAVTWDGVKLWSPSSVGVKWKPIPNAPRPGKTAGSRFVQMRAFARKFQARLRDTRDDDRGVKRNLRLLTRPIYRYPATKSGPDGGLFAFVAGTDPEVLLLIETTTDKSPSWRYALVRMNSDAVEVLHGGEQIWAADKLDHEAFKQSDPYYHQPLKKD